jgi:hypothetical protein
LGDGRAALIIYIPVPKVKGFQRVHSLLVSELEKKYNQTVVLIGQVRIFTFSLFFHKISFYYLIASNFAQTNTQIENTIETKTSTKVCSFGDEKCFVKMNFVLVEH